LKNEWKNKKNTGGRDGSCCTPTRRHVGSSEFGVFNGFVCLLYYLENDGQRYDPRPGGEGTTRPRSRMAGRAYSNGDGDGFDFSRFFAYFTNSLSATTATSTAYWYGYFYT
jgi:hypothetical protein